MTARDIAPIDPATPSAVGQYCEYEIMGLVHGARMTDLANYQPHCGHGDHPPAWRRQRSRMLRVSDVHDRLMAADLAASCTYSRTA